MVAHKSTSSHAMTTEQLTYRCYAPWRVCMSRELCQIGSKAMVQTCITSRQEHNNLADSTPVLGQSRLKVPGATTFTFYTIE
jgi:hypothetical protein